MKQTIIIDTGPLVAFINQRDAYHAWVKTQLSQLTPPFFTCEAVLSETLFLLRQSSKAVRTVFELIKRGALKMTFELQAEVESIQTLMSRYENVPVSLADACLVRMSEQHDNSAILTLDSDFRVYRKNGRQVIPVLMPPASK